VPENRGTGQRIPNVKGAMFALLPGGSHLNPHRDPFAGSLRYHLGLSTPNSDDCRIFVDGQVYAWRDGEDVMFDETYVHWVKNETDKTRVILFCDIERPLSNRLMTRINRSISAWLGRATAPQNLTTNASAGSTRLMPGARTPATSSAAWSSSGNAVTPRPIASAPGVGRGGVDVVGVLAVWLTAGFINASLIRSNSFSDSSPEARLLSDLIDLAFDALFSTTAFMVSPALIIK
jgi:hypothetical protein